MGRLSKHALAVSSSLILLMVLLLASISQTSGQTNRLGTWTSPQYLGQGWWQSITVDRTGAAHIAWYGSEETSAGSFPDLLIYAQRAFNGEWSKPVDVYFAGSGGYTVRNALAVTSTGLVGAYFRAGVDHIFSSAPAEGAYTAANWNAGTPLASGYYLNIISDDQDILHAFTSGSALSSEDVPVQSVNVETDRCVNCSNLIYRRSLDGGRTWSIPVNLTNDERRGADKPDVRIGASGRLYVNWDVGSDWYSGRGRAEGLQLRYSDDHGVTWSDIISLTGDENNTLQKPMQGAFTELGDGSLMTVWRYSTGADNLIYYQLSSDVGATWSEPEPVPNITARFINDTSLDDYELLTDKLGNPHLFAVADTPGANPSSLLHLEYRQGQWRKPEIIYERFAGHCAEWPKAAIGPQNDIHLTWFVRSDPTQPPDYDYCLGSTVNLEIFYAFRSGTMPERPTQAFLPTQTPPPTQIAGLQFDSTPTPFPTVQPIHRAVAPTTSDVYASRTVLSAIFASLLVCGVVIAANRMLR